MARTVDIPLVFRAFQVFTPAERERSNLFHRLIRAAIGAGEADRAGRLMAEHVLQGRDSLLDRIAVAPLARARSWASRARTAGTRPPPTAG